MDDTVWVILIVGGFIAVVVLIFVRKYFLVKILRILKERYEHIYYEHYPKDSEPDFLLTVKKGFLPFQLLQKKEIKDDKELMNLVYTNIFLVLVKLILLGPFIVFCLVRIALAD